MNITAVESSTLRAIAYDRSIGLLRLEFGSRAVYDYFGVPAEVHDALLHASSVGACFNKIVRGCFPFCRVWQAGAEDRPEGGR